MCPLGARAADDARSAGLTRATCPRTGAELRSDESGIWYVVERADGSTMLPDVIDPPLDIRPIRAPGAERFR